CRLTQCSRFPWDPDSLICAWILVPQEGFEPPTARLRSGCSTTELLRRSPIAVARGYRGRKSACHAARRYPGTHPLRLEHLTNARPCVDRRLGGAFRLRLGLGFVLQTGIVGRMHQRDHGGGEWWRRLARAARERLGFGRRLAHRRRRFEGGGCAAVVFWGGRWRLRR